MSPEDQIENLHVKVEALQKSNAELNNRMECVETTLDKISRPLDVQPPENVNVETQFAAEPLEESEDNAETASQSESLIILLQEDDGNNDSNSEQQPAAGLDEEISENTGVGSKDELGVVRTRLDEAQKRNLELEPLRGELETSCKQLHDSVAELGVVRTQLDEAQKRNLELEPLRGELETSHKQRLDSVAELGVVRTQLDEAQKRNLELEPLREELGTSRKQLGELQRQLETLQHRVEVDKRLKALMWPAFLDEEPLSDWKPRLEAALTAADPEPSSVLVMATLFTYNAAREMGGAWERRLFDAAHDFSGAFLGWCKKLDYGSEEAVGQAKAWAAAFNQQCSKTLKIEVPEPETPFENSWMVSYAGSRGSDVSEVQSWCIRDSKGRIQKQAEVTRK
jgi:hypothetical protein